MNADMTPVTRRFRWLALTGNLALIVWIVMWQSTLSTHPHLNPLTMAVVWIIPLLLPLPGILAGKPYTHAWANFVLMLYFIHGFTIVSIDNGERGLAAVELLLTTLAFAGNIFYARHRGKELGMKLTRLSEVEKQERSRFGD